jgi:hypothetical protein
MNDITMNFERYLKDVLALSTKCVPWNDTASLPFYMRELYNFSSVILMKKPFLLMIAKSKQEQTPATVKKHLMQLSEKWKNDAIYVRSSISSYNRQRLIEYKIPFVIPGTQMYFPMLGIDLREHFKKFQEERPIFSPATQAVILYVLYNKLNIAVTPTDMSKNLGYSPMTMTRAYEEMNSAGVGEQEVRGKKRFLSFPVTGKALWEKVLPYLKTPLKMREYIFAFQGKDLEVYAGFSALARYSTLVEPKNPTYAIGNNEWKLLEQQRKVVQLPWRVEGAIEIELWSYRPSLFANHNTADRLSLYLSLKDTKDERVEEALEKMMEGMEW